MILDDFLLFFLGVLMHPDLFAVESGPSSTPRQLLHTSSSLRTFEGISPIAIIF